MLFECKGITMLFDVVHWAAATKHNAKASQSQKKDVFRDNRRLFITLLWNEVIAFYRQRSCMKWRLLAYYLPIIYHQRFSSMIASTKGISCLDFGWRLFAFNHYHTTTSSPYCFFVSTYVSFQCIKCYGQHACMIFLQL